MLPSALINFLPLKKIPALPPQSLDFVERERERELVRRRRKSWRQGTRDEGRVARDLRLPIYDCRFSIFDYRLRLRIADPPASAGRVTSKTDFSFSKYFAHPYRGIWPALWLLLWLAGLPVKDVPP